MKEILTEEAVERLLAWYRSAHRPLPWRETRDPYRIWISEVMLQQTRVEAVKPYYARFLAACPDVASLARIDEDKLMKLWEGLGYYSRARNLQRAAKTVVEQYGGIMPRTRDELRGLAGIGDYTAGAIASIAYDERVPAVDGNVLRVLARLQASREDIMLPVVKKDWTARLSEVIPPEAGDFTQGLIELGATLCGPNGDARCSECPLAVACRAHRDGVSDELPVRSAKRPRRIEERTVLAIKDGRRTVISKRPDKGLLAGLYELPSIKGHPTGDTLTDAIRALGFEPLRIEPLEDAKHIFSHVEWHMKGYLVRITPDFDGRFGREGMLLVEDEELRAHYAIPAAFAAYKKYL